ncbi:hypothetical protein MKEN_00559300 [Mycena kentingensis (nom. inval.)]|nr:hypothetical protein MKEN_00559300 [Mycena kentingensis (nom. inval.)]
MNSLSSMQPSDATWWDLAPDMVNSPIGAELEPFPYNIQVDTQFCFPPRSDVGLLPFSGSRGPSGYESDAGFGGIEQDPRFWDAMLQTPVGASFLDVPSAPWSPSGSDAGSLLASRRSSLASSSGSSSYGSPYMTPYTPLPGPYDFDHFEYDPAFLAASTPSPRIPPLALRSRALAHHRDAHQTPLARPARHHQILLPLRRNHHAPLAAPPRHAPAPLQRMRALPRAARLPPPGRAHRVRCALPLFRPLSRLPTLGTRDASGGAGRRLHGPGVQPLQDAQDLGVAPERDGAARVQCVRGVCASARPGAPVEAEVEEREGAPEAASSQGEGEGLGGAGSADFENVLGPRDVF